VLSPHSLPVKEDGTHRSAFELAAQPELNIEALGKIWPELPQIPIAIRARLQADAKYAVYVDR
jgi:tRNA uridine 5-carboxymethylaminomethyl modification enzyme